MGNSAEMPRYKCHKEVHALKIEQLRYHEGGDLNLIFADEQYEPIILKDSEAKRFEKAIRNYMEDVDQGYLVVYEDGYRSWSPTKAFEEGYTRL